MNKTLLWLSLSAGLFVATAVEAKPPKKIKTTEEGRLEYLQKAKFYEPVDISQSDFGNSGKKYDPFETVKCEFIEPEVDIPGGRSPKFLCLEKEDDDEKVKYGVAGRQTEIYGEVMGSRLLKGIGYYADDNYPVRVECENCPEDPWDYIRYSQLHPGNSNKLRQLRYTSKSFDRDTRVFNPAVIEKKAHRTEIVEEDGKEGFSFKEFGNYEGLSEEQTVHRDGLYIMGALLQHADSKGDNQRLYCPKDQLIKLEPEKSDKESDYDCRQPIGMIHDLGYTFGRGHYYLLQSSKTELEDWKKAPVFSDPEACVIKVYKDPGGTLGSRKVSPASRDFIGGLLGQMSDNQIYTLFDSARPYLKYPMGTDYEDITNQWVDTFKTKRTEIQTAPCTE